MRSNITFPIDYYQPEAYIPSTDMYSQGSFHQRLNETACRRRIWVQVGKDLYFNDRPGRKVRDSNNAIDIQRNMRDVS